ncbi:MULTISPECIES: ATP-binding protein [Leucobacter]|uniref:Histidine kinase/DNA gyrase B/HSP90-like ATPase n=2 Tax=Leucobacter TaxID=55968 RepID=A0A4Q7U4B8_9MICO|nr:MULTISPECIES: ATP-binding protein [Leucobacter]MBL3691133.1 ATP-binding protein [Leucobacter chromiireducens subsp. chromiireducens]MBL3700790.1 ATP-binding protein [Leucobacter luti]RZT68373.1 histidine kinase/DNA gyrase B/HSP90-like ATPase [Leucobacter luti]
MTEEDIPRFRPRARLLQLLGDQLIGSPRLAIFELVKNAYDADATRAEVTMSHLDTPDATIEVVDDGDGMSYDTLRNIWLVPGHDHKAKDRAKGTRTTRGRLPLGEKGVGRFAVHKLGRAVEVVTRQADGPELVLKIDWEEIANSEFLDEARVEIVEREPALFIGKQGTSVAVTGLRGEPWTRGEVRRLFRQITSISSPFAARSDDFAATLILPQQKKWLDDVPDTETLLESAPWRFTFSLEGNQFSWRYEFRGFNGIALSPRTVEGTEYGVLLDPKDLPERDQDLIKAEKKPPRAVRSSLAHQEGIGPLSGTLMVYDRDKDVIEKIGHSASLQEFLNESGGIRVYRDGIRVYNYGEPGDDWLGLDIRRVNSPTKRISNNIVVGAVDLSLEESRSLEEKTNREGFVEGIALGRMRALIRGAIAVFESERNKDKQNLRKLLSKKRDSLSGGIEKPLQQIKTLAKKNNLSNEVDPLIDKAQKAYDDMREIMLRAGISSMSLVIVYHEIDHGVRLLHTALRGGADATRAVQQARDLVAVLDSFGDLLRKGQASDHDVRDLAERAAELNSVRLSNHDIDLEIRVDRSPNALFALSRFPLGLVLGAVTNLIDNSVYWLSSRWPENEGDSNRKLLIAVDTESYSGPALIIADNGPGFADGLEDSTEPFFTRRPDGIGVGLYYVNLIMHTIGGSLRMVDTDLVPLGPDYDGAALALVFPRG